jgi:hypothetical protein
MVTNDVSQLVLENSHKEKILLCLHRETNGIGECWYYSLRHDGQDAAGSHRAGPYSTSRQAQRAAISWLEEHCTLD